MEEYNLAVLCLYYLSHGCFDLSLSAESVENHVLEGYYAFSDYAFVYWLDHLEHCVADLDISNSGFAESLAAAIREFLARHISDEPKISTSPSIRDAFHIFQAYEFSNRLGKAVEFWRNRMQTKAEQSNAVAVLDLDQVLIQIRSIIDELASRKLATSLSKKLRVFHGTNIFKCARYNCEYFYEGFGTIQERDQHHDKHERAYLCTFSGCPRAIFGLEDVKTLEQHIANAHHVGKIDDSKFPVHLEPKSIDIKEAVKTGNIAAVERWAQQFNGYIPDNAVGISTYYSGGSRRVRNGTPLQLAYRCSDSKILDFFLKRISEPHEIIERVIHSVLLDGKSNLIPWAIKFPVGKPNLDQAYKTITVMMGRGEDHTALQLLKKLNTTPDNLKPRGKKSYVTAAAESGCLTCLQYLIIHCGMDINFVDNQQRTALIAAAKMNQTGIIKFLVRTSLPRIYFTNKKGESALSKAAANGHDHIIRILFPEPVRDDVVPWLKIAKLRNAARDGNLEEASRILDDVSVHADTEDNDHYTPLLHAVENGHESIVNALLSRRGSSIDVNHKCNCHHANFSAHEKLRKVVGATALILAAIHGYTSIVCRLLECRDIKTEERVLINHRIVDYKRTALQLAEYNKDLEIVRLIQEHNARK